MNDNEEYRTRPTVRSRGRMMDFAPRGTAAPRPVRNDQNLTEEEQRRREIARREVARREEIQRQIQRQKEEDIIAKRRAIAARRDLARRLEAEREENDEALAIREREYELEREREEVARKRALIEARAMRERQRVMAKRRAEQAREELEIRREAESMLRPSPVHKVKNPIGSKDPLARRIKLEEPEEEPEEREEPARKRGIFRRRAEKPAPAVAPEEEIARERVERRLGSAKKFEEDFNELDKSSKIFDRDEEIDEFIEDKKADDFLDDIDEIEKKVEEAEEDTSRNNDRYVLGGRSPFINTAVEKRPLSGGNKTFESTASAAMMGSGYRSRSQRPAKVARPKARGRYVPYEEPIPHKNIYARTVAKEKENKNVPTMVVGESPKSSKMSLIIAIILTVILGATVGAIAYLALFQ